MEDRCIVNTIKQRKRKWLGHVLRHDVLLRDILEGRMLGKHTRWRRRLQLRSNICYVGTFYKSVKKRAEARCLWRFLETEVNDMLFIAVHQKKTKYFTSVSKRTLCVSSSVNVKHGDDFELGPAATSAELSNKTHEKPGPPWPCNSSLNVVICGSIYNKIQCNASRSAFLYRGALNTLIVLVLCEYSKFRIE